MRFNNPFMTFGPRYALATAVALVVSLAAFAIASSGASAASGGIGTGGDTGESAGGTDLNLSSAKYERLWERVSPVNKRWARTTSDCESGRDPDAIGGNGDYRGAFQFTQETWSASPKTPGGDPIDYAYKTQAVVAVNLKLRDGTGPWPVCG